MFRWLHLSDIHVGITDQDWLWPTFKHALYDDFGVLLGDIGAPDVLIFSGDIAQMGVAKEYERFSDILAEIREKLSVFGAPPRLIAVPGNHDLVRPKAGGPLEAAMRQVPADAQILRQVFEADSEYRQMLGAAFENFVSWQDGMIAAGIHVPPAGRGSLPGDLAFDIPYGGGSAGIITLNSAWLQLSAREYRGQLHVDPRQINSATGNDPQSWLNQHDIKFVVTHHPTDWLADASRKLWDGEIAPAGRFDIHLYGHMHQHSGQATAFGGGPTRRQLQAASIFGLEKINGEMQRLHGYSLGEIGERHGTRQISIWPRTLHTMRDGRHKLVPDQDHELSADNSFAWLLSEGSSGTKASPGARPLSMDEASKPDAKTAATIELRRYHLQASRAHAVVRRIEQEQAKSALDEGGVLWIVRDWGLGEDGFVWSLLCEAGEIEQAIFRLDLERYATREEFLTQLRLELGCSFEQLCEYLSTLDAAVLIFDNVPAGVTVQGVVPLERDLEEVARIVREFAPSTRVVLRGRPRQTEIRRPFVELVPFDEPDVADYVRAHELGDEIYAKPDMVTKLWQHTGGSPVRLDAILGDLKYTSLDDLVRADADHDESASDLGVPAALVGTVNELSRSDLPQWTRAFHLLEALTSLPRGEQLERMRRFLGVHPFHPSHVRELETRGLIEIVQLSGMTPDDGVPARTLVVPRIVFDFVRNHMSHARRRDIDSKALTLYFGDKWQSGQINRSLSGKRCADPLCEPYEVANACAIVEKAVIQARDDNDQIGIEAALRLASGLIEVLLKGHHFAASAQLCERVIPHVPENGNEQRLDILRYELARSLRMLSRRDEAREIFEAIDRNHLAKWQRRLVDLQMALIHEHTDNQEAARFAREVLKGGRSDGLGIQARSIIAEQEPNRAERLSELATLEARARKIGSAVAANNIALSRALYDQDPDSAAAHLDRVVESAEADGDFYNGTKAIIRRVRLQQQSGGNRTIEQVNRLIRAYQHLHNERGGTLFDQSHDALWSAFSDGGDGENLLRIFRHSSLIWRLRGEEIREDPFLEQLSRIVSQGSTLPGLSRELAYYRSRAAASLERQTASRIALTA